MLVGRDRERAAVATLIEGARGSHGGALVLRGLPGVGKSSLLEDAVSRAGDAQALWTQGIESESPLPFAALHRLLRPVMASLDRLPAPQATALRAAFGEAPGEGGDRFLVFLAALSLLAEAAEQGPVLAVVDDAHWLDDASTAALLFVARRLQAERVAMLFAAREGDLRSFDSGDLPSVTMGGVDEDAAGALLAGRSRAAVPAEVRARLMASTGGNPLALVELSDALSADQLSGRAPLPAQLPLTEGVERAFLDRYRRLPDGAQMLLLVAAADDSGRLTTVLRAAAALGAGEDALDEVERSRLLRVRGGSVELRHPLVRSAVYGAATSSQRRRAHRVLAGVLISDEDADRRAWHRAAAAEEPDESVVAALDRAAERARDRGGHEAASAAWERAAELTRDDDARAERLYAAARSAWLGAQPARARALADSALAGAVEPGLRADAARLRARIEWNAGSLQLGHRMVMNAAREVAPHDADRAREMAMFGAALASFGGSSGIDVRPVDLVAADMATTPRQRCFADLLVGLDHLARAEWADAVPRLRDALATTASVENADQDLLPNLGIAAQHLGDDALSLRFHDLLLARARSTGAVVMILYALTRRCFSLIATGKWGVAHADASEALELARGTDQPGLTGLPLAWLTLLAALRGDDSATSLAGQVDEIATTYPTGILATSVADLVRWARAIEAAGKPQVAMQHLEQIVLGSAQRMAAIDRMEAAVRAGRREQAATWLKELEDFAVASGASWAWAAVEHGRGVLTEGGEAEPHFKQALEHHRDSARVFDRARTQLAFGEFLRRSRRRVDAREHLRAALGTFEDLGARPWAERAVQELRASGETARKRDPSTVTELTAQETQVAKLVAQGMSNRDVAAQLFLSPRTIDFHLRNVFAKLGVTSRAELARIPLT